MRSIASAAALCGSLLLTLPAYGQGVAIDSAVYHERLDGGARTIQPATRLLRGDRVITILRWEAPGQARYTATSAVPPDLLIESASFGELEVSADGGRSWTRLEDTRRMPRGTTHLRWPVRGEGQLSYRAIVR
jgi:hypothetical protein